MRYWLLTTEFPPFFGGGIATYCLHTTRMFSENGDEVTVFVPDERIEERIREDVVGEIRVVRFKPGQHRIYQHLGLISALSYEFSELLSERIKREGPPDLIEAQDYLGIAYFLLQKKYCLWEEFRDITILITLHTPKFLCDIWNQAPYYKLPDYWIGELELFCLKSGDILISPSNFLLNELSGYVNLPADRTFVVRNPYRFDDPSFFKGSRKAKEVIFLGRLEYRKGCLQLLGYMKRLWEKGVDVMLQLIGGDTYFHPKAMVMSECLKKRYQDYFEKGFVEWIGAVEPSKLGETLSTASFGVIPSLRENFPYVVLELLSHGLIPIISDSGGQAEVIEDGRSGFIFSHNNNSFEEKLLQAINLSEDERVRILEEGIRSLKEMCSYEVVYQAKMECIDKVLSLKKGKRTFPFVREVLCKTKGEEKVLASYYEEPGLLSVIIPYYNMGRYVRETLESVFKSNYPNKEVIVVNDGSDDPESIAVLYNLEAEYPIRVIHKENEGLARARNTGAFHAKGEFIAFLDADDMVETEYYEKAINILKEYENVDFVGAWQEYFDGVQGVWITWNPEPPYLLVHNTINSSGIVVRKRSFMLYGLNDPEMEYGLEDYESIVRMISFGCRGVAIPKTLHRYRIRRDSMLRSIPRDGMVYLYSLVAKKNPEIYEEFAVDVINLINANGPGYLYDNPSWHLPQVGFVRGDHEGEINEDLWNRQYIPSEIKERMISLWQKKWFRAGIKLFFRLKLHKLFR